MTDAVSELPFVSTICNSTTNEHPLVLSFQRALPVTHSNVNGSGRAAVENSVRELSSSTNDHWYELIGAGLAESVPSNVTT